MKRTRFSRRGGFTRDAEQLISLATGLAKAGARLEHAWWETQLSALIERLLRNHNDEALSAALDRLYESDPAAYDALADLIEAGAETAVIKPESGEGAALQDALLIALPILAWSRFSIVSGQMTDTALASVAAALKEHILAPGTQLALADFLWSPDQLPRGYANTFDLTRRLALSAVRGQNMRIDPSNLPETTTFLSDVRYLVGVVAAPHGVPMFRWQAEDVQRDAVTANWKSQAGEILAPIFPASAIEPVLPDAYHAACRQADRESRPYSIKASVAFLQTTLNVLASDLRAVAGPFYDRRLEEYRIGFTLADEPEVLHGVVWPLLDADDESSDISGSIEAVLKECNVGHIMMLEQRFPMEYCDDCGAPFYPDPEGEPAHAEMPEDEEGNRPTHLH